MSALVKDYLSHNKAFFSQLKAKKSIHTRKDIDFANLSEKVHAEYSPIFVLSSGRNGTLLLTNLLEQSNQCIALHEPEPELSMSSKMAYELFDKNPEFVKGMFEGARYEMLRTGFLLNKKIIETNNRITFFAHQIAELYPNARFIHLVRHPASFIKSGLSRNWYTGETLYDEARIVSSDSAQWKMMNRYEKVAWLWNETNLFIEEFKETNAKKVLTVKAEDLFEKPETSQKILEYCGIDDVSITKIRKVISIRANKGKNGSFDKELLQKSIENFTTIRHKYNYQ